VLTQGRGIIIKKWDRSHAADSATEMTKLSILNLEMIRPSYSTTLS
jgi:hypothetical protein